MDDSGTISLAEDNQNDIELILTALSAERQAGTIFVVRDREVPLDYPYHRVAHRSRLAENPKVDGLEVLQSIKADPDPKATLVVMPTSSREERDLLRSCDFGTNTCAVKPRSFRGFVKTLSDVGLFWRVVNQPPSTAERG